MGNNVEIDSESVEDDASFCDCYPNTVGCLSDLMMIALGIAVGFPWAFSLGGHLASRDAPEVSRSISAETPSYDGWIYDAWSSHEWSYEIKPPHGPACRYCGIMLSSFVKDAEAGPGFGRCYRWRHKAERLAEE